MNQHEQLQQAARFALEVLLWTQAGEPVPSMEREAIKQLKTALQEPVEESVACMDMLRRARNLLSHPPTWSSENAASRHRLLEEIDAFITAPPQRKPLTDEEIADMWVGILYDSPPSGVHEDGLVPHRLARQIERAHGIV